jgi:acetyl esterase/lipase
MTRAGSSRFCVKLAESMRRQRTSSPPAAVTFLALCLTLAIPEGAAAQTVWQPSAGRTQIPLWPSRPPLSRNDTGPEAPHDAVDPSTRINKLVGSLPYQYIEHVTTPTLTLYQPAGNNTHAAVIVYPGGGFNVLAMDIEGTEACEWLVSRGVTCVLLKYRVPCRPVGPYRDCPSAHIDAQRAMRIVWSRAREWRIAPDRIGVIGFSAGAHMAIVSSTQFERRYPAVDGADSVSARTDFVLVLYPGRVARREPKFVLNPDSRVSNQTPPTFIVHSSDDPMNPVQNSHVYAAALRRAGILTEVHIFDRGGHAFGLRRTGLPVSAWPRLAEAWMTRLGHLQE